MRRRQGEGGYEPKASVVITNPTHYAVALEFSFETMQAPTVLAKGRDLHAAEIREEARWAGVPMIENPPLARSLYRAVEVGSLFRLIFMRRWRGFWLICTGRRRRRWREERMRERARGMRGGGKR